MRSFDLAAGVVDPLTVNGSYSASRLDLTVGIAGTSTTISAAPVAAVDYDYNQAAQLSALAGNWPGFFTTGDDGTVAVQASGAFATTTSAGCSLTGTATPRPSGKNVFNVNITFGPAPCLLPNGTASGVAVISRSTPTTNALAVLVTTPARDAGAAFFAER